jgi:transposase
MWVCGSLSTFEEQGLSNLVSTSLVSEEEKSEYKTPSKCPLCRSENVMARGRLFKCLSCGLEANRDAVGVLNIGYLHGGGVSGVACF